MKRLVKLTVVPVCVGLVSCSSGTRDGRHVVPWSTVSVGAMGGYSWRLMQSADGKNRCLGIVGLAGDSNPSESQATKALDNGQSSPSLIASGQCAFGPNGDNAQTRAVSIVINFNHSISAGLVPAGGVKVKMASGIYATKPLRAISGYGDAKYWIGENVDVGSPKFSVLGGDGKLVDFSSTI